MWALVTSLDRDPACTNLADALACLDLVALCIEAPGSDREGLLFRYPIVSRCRTRLMLPDAIFRDLSGA